MPQNTQHIRGKSGLKMLRPARGGLPPWARNSNTWPSPSWGGGYKGERVRAWGEGGGRGALSENGELRGPGVSCLLDHGWDWGQGSGKRRHSPGLTPAGPPRTARSPDSGKALLMAGAGPELSLLPPRAPPRGCQQEAALSWLRLLLSQEAPGRRQRAIPAATPVSSFSLCPSGTASFALKAVNVWSHSSPFSLAALHVSRSQPDQ